MWGKNKTALLSGVGLLAEILVMGAVSPACSGKPLRTESSVPIMADYQKISAETAHTMMRNTKDFVLIDVRNDDEFAEKHIDGAINIPDYEIEDRAEASLPDKDAVVLVYCRSGRRSANAAIMLVEKGYTHVFDFGGIADWPYDTVSE